MTIDCSVVGTDLPESRLTTDAGRLRLFANSIAPAGDMLVATPRITDV